MITVSLIVIAVLVVIGLVLLVMKSGLRGGRHDQSGHTTVNAQVQDGSGRSDVRASGSAND